MGYGTSLGTAHEDEISYVLEKGISDKQLADQAEINSNTASGDFQSRFYATDQSTMPLEASRKLTDALKQVGGTEPPEKTLETNFLNKLKAPYINPSNDEPKAPPKVLFNTKAGPITDQDIDSGINVALSAGPGSIEDAGKNSVPWIKNYVDHFLKQPDAKVPKVDNPMYADETDKVLKMISDALGEHAAEAKGNIVNKWNPETSLTYQKMMANKSVDPLEQQPWIHTVADAAKEDYPKTQLHPDNFKSIDQSKLSTKQAWDLFNTHEDFKKGSLSKGEYLNELEEYEKFTASKAKIIAWKNIPITEGSAITHGKQVLNDLLDDYPKLLESNKQTPKEKFLDALDNINNSLNTKLANIRDKYINTVNEPKLEPKIPVPPEIAAKGYTEPAYRGLTVHGDKQVNPVFNFHVDPYNPTHDISGMYSTSSPMLADMYSAYLAKHPGYKIPEGTFNEGSQVMPLFINTKDYHYYDAKGGHWANANPKAIEQAQAKGKKGVIVDNVRDEPGSTTSLPPKKIFITFKSGAGTVKSRFAKDFDPSSPNILHGIGSVAVGGAAAGMLTREGDTPKDYDHEAHVNWLNDGT